MNVRTLLLVLFFFVAAGQAQDGKDLHAIIPRPASIQYIDDEFELTDAARIVADRSVPDIASAAEELSSRLRQSTGYPMPVVGSGEAEDGDIVLALVPKNKAEGYTLVVDDDVVTITGAGRAGLFYGIETLLQMFPSEIYSRHVIGKDEWTLPCVTIEDVPRFSWRGMHLDVSRHFFPAEFIYTYIDMLALHKFNTFHWHLVDDQGWRIEIKSWPRLTEVGGWRVDREDKHWNEREPQAEGDSATYGGFYTQAQIRDIVAYAASKNITVVPEIEMPAHVTSALAAYPQFSCAGGPFTVPPGGVWPITDIYCAGNDSTFLFVQDILTEVMDLFPGEYIHIGGDEATKTEWERCAKCQARITAESLADEAELQSYFIRRIERFLVSNGRRLIGWDEILEGGLAPEATVMSWRGVAGGVAAARAGHDAVMTPGTHCYFDHYQGPQDLEPLAIGGYTPLRKVYDFEPIPDSLSAEEARHILGAQANVWTEYIPTPEHVQYMTMPRMAAMAEVVWSPKEGKDWLDFSRRVANQLQRYDKRGYNYAPSAFIVNHGVTFDSVGGTFIASMANEMASPVIRYTADGSDPKVSSVLYEGPFPVDNTMTIRAAAFEGKERLAKVSSQKIFVHEGLGKRVAYGQKPTRYLAGGETALTNGLRGGFSFSDGNWQGFRGNGFDCTIDLGASIEIGAIATTHLQKTSSWIFFPTRVEFFVGDDSSSMKSVAVFERPIVSGHDGPSVVEYRQQFRNLSGRFVKVVGTSVGVCPDWHTGAGEPAWVFIDEIIVE